VTRSYVSNLRKGRIENPGFEKLRAIAKAMNLPPELCFEDVENLRDVSGVHPLVVRGRLRAHFKTAACGARTDTSTPEIGQYLPKTVRTWLATPPLRQGFETHSK
jgi:transcriptional regulator with XRE-family HTH domain